MDRRSFLTGTGALALSQLLFGCSGRGNETLSVYLLKNSIPAQLVQQFRRQPQSSGLDLKPVSQLTDLFTQLQTFKVRPQTADGRRFFNFFSTSEPGQPRPMLSSLGHYWLAAAVQQGLIQPLQLAQSTYWNQLLPQWQALVTQQGQVWGAPYRWGTTAIAYRKDKFKRLGWTPSDWSDLWRPELRGRISLLDQPREVIGLTLKKLGRSYNSKNNDAIAALEPELRALHQQVKLYSSDAYLQPLILEDTWLAVGWSTDILPIVQRNNQIAAVVPRSGTALWTDLWVRPAPAAPSAAAMQWIEFWWQPEIARQLSRLSNGGSPRLSDSSLNNFQTLLPNQQVFSRSEFILPLPEAANQYRDLWLAVRRMA